MKILKHGSKYSKNKIAVCPLCGCVLEYNNNDTEIEYCFTTFYPTYKNNIKCPECDKEICIGTMIVN